MNAFCSGMDKSQLRVLFFVSFMNNKSQLRVLFLFFLFYYDYDDVDGVNEA